MWKGNNVNKYAGIGFFFLTGFFIAFGLNIWLVSVSLILFLVLMHRYFCSYDPDFVNNEFSGVESIYILITFILFGWWLLGIGAIGILYIFYQFIHFLYRYLNFETYRFDLKTEFFIIASAGILLLLYKVIM